jgi:hypothetical protein
MTRAARGFVFRVIGATPFRQRLGTTNDANDANDAKSRAFPRRRQQRRRKAAFPVMCAAGASSRCPLDPSCDGTVSGWINDWKGEPPCGGRKPGRGQSSVSRSGHVRIYRATSVPDWLSLRGRPSGRKVFSKPSSGISQYDDWSGQFCLHHPFNADSLSKLGNAESFAEIH